MHWSHSANGLSISNVYLQDAMCEKAGENGYVFPTALQSGPIGALGLNLPDMSVKHRGIMYDLGVI